MEKELIVSGSAIGESNFHIQLTPAFRQDIFIDEKIAELTLAYILEKLAKLKVSIVAYNYGPDYLHLFVANVRFVGKKFWSEGHFYRSVGAVNKETMKHYIEDCQDKTGRKFNCPRLADG